MSGSIRITGSAADFERRLWLEVTDQLRSDLATAEQRIRALEHILGPAAANPQAAEASVDTMPTAAAGPQDSHAR